MNTSDRHSNAKEPLPGGDATGRNASEQELMEFERLLTEAGFDYEVVAGCPDPKCAVCARTGMAVAA